jgi:flavin reductase (DIM6/NTAB) family NADH-FMN oxidoreductase RutF
MFYETAKNNHGLPHDPFKAIVAPRPIGWISSLSANGELNLAPYSYFNGVSSKPPCVMFASEGHKDSIANIAETREFVCSLATWELREHKRDVGDGRARSGRVYAGGIERGAVYAREAAACRRVAVRA